MNPFLEREPIAFAHRGGAREAPESTLFAISNAIWKGATGIELDVHQSADGELVVCHDARVDRTTNGTGAVAELSVSELQRLDGAYWFVYGRGARRGRGSGAYVYRGQGPADPRFRVARLREVLAQSSGIVLNLDIKARAPAVPPYESVLARALLDAGRTSDVIVTSFSDDSIGAFSAVAPGIPTAAGEQASTAFVREVLAGVPPDRAITRHVALQLPARAGGLRVVDERVVLAAHRLGLAVHVWTVDRAADMEELLDLGVDGIMSDVPSVMCEVFARRSARLRSRRAARGD